MRPPVDDIPAPPFPAKVPWINVAPLRMDKQRGRPVLVEFWDFCREAAVRAAVARLEIEHPVCIDLGFELWRAYDNAGWPARYLWDGDGHLAEYHYGEGAYAETELAIQELLGTERDPVAPLHPEDVPTASIAAQTPDQAGAYSGPYGAGAVWAVLGGTGELHVNGERVAVQWPGAHLLVEHNHHVNAVLDLRVGASVTCYATCFTPGVVLAGA